MKYLVLSIAAFLAIALFAFKGTSDDVKSQSEILKGMDVNQEYVTYKPHKKEDGSYSFSREDYSNKIVELLPESNLPNKHFIAMLKMNYYDDASSYMPTNMAFPITYSANYYEGSPKSKEMIGDFPTKIRTGGNASRIVFLDGFIYELTEYYSPEKYWVWSVSVPKGYASEGEEGAGEDEGKKKKKLSFKDKLKNLKDMAVSGGDATSKKLVEEDVIGKLEAYMKAGAIKQKKVYAEWEKSVEGSNYIKTIAERRDAYSKFVKSHNAAYWDSPEGRAIAARMKDEHKNGGKDKVTIDNETGKDIFVYEEGSRNGSVIRVNSSNTFDCSKSYYVGSGSSVNGGGYKVVSANGSCGQTVEVQ